MGAANAAERGAMHRRAWLGTAAGLCLLPGAGIGARAQTSDEFGSGALTGAGSTFVHPLMAAWARKYRASRSGGLAIPVAGSGLDDEALGAALDYEPVGSQAGIARVRARAVDFATSEMALPTAELDRDLLLQFPLVCGAVVIAANLDGLAGRELRLTGPVLADIYRGRIKGWSDARIAQLNPGLVLPSVPIAVLHRADGSGTTFTFTQFLVNASTAWNSEVGSDLLVNWPVGEGFKGNAGVARALQRTPNAIAYLGQGQVPPRMALVSVQGAHGAFVAPGAARVQAAVAAAPWQASNGFNTSLIQTAGEGSYPIVAAVFALLDRRSTGQRRRMTRSFFMWALTQGRDAAVRLGYTPLPAALSQQVLAVLR